MRRGNSSLVGMPYRSKIDHVSRVGAFPGQRMQATTIEVEASHLSLITHPQEITDLILNAAGRSG